MAFSVQSGVSLPLPQAGSFYPQQTGDPRGVPLRLGPVTFRDQEHPHAGLPLPLVQQTAEHFFIGGGKVVQALGAQPKDITWHGYLFDASALPRTGELNRLCAGGLLQRMSWGQFAYDVIVLGFEPTIRNQWLVEYSITLKVVSDQSGQFTNSAAPSVNVQVQNLYQQAYSRAGSIAALDSTTSSWQTTLAGIGNQLNDLGPIASASSSQISPITSSLNSLISTIQTYVSPLYSSSATSSIAQKLGFAIGTLNAIQVIVDNLGRGQASQSVQVVGGSAYDLAAQYYGDVTLYNVIMQANSLLHPTFAPGLAQSIVIPPATSIGGPS